MADSLQNIRAQETTDSSCFEVILGLWRISKALGALPDSADDRTQLRWKNGIGMEIVGTISASYGILKT